MSLFTKRLYVGVEMDSGTIKLAGRHKSVPSAHLDFYEIVDLVKENGLASPHQLDDQHYIQQLRNWVVKYHLKHAQVVAALPSAEAILHAFKVSSLQSESNLVEVIQNELQHLTQKPLDNMRIACQQIEVIGQANHGVWLFAGAVPNSLIERHLRILRESGLQARVIDLNALGLYNAFCHFHTDIEESLVTLVQVEREYSICVVIPHGGPPFFYISSVGGNAITTQIMEEMGVSFSQAETYKSRMYQPEWTNLESFKHSKLAEIFFGFAEKLIMDVKKCIQHVQVCEEIAGVGQIYLTGAGAPLDLLRECFLRLELASQIWNPLDHHDGFHLVSLIGGLVRSD